MKQETFDKTIADSTTANRAQTKRATESGVTIVIS